MDARLASQVSQFLNCPTRKDATVSPCDNCSLRNQGVEVDLTDRSRPGHVSLCRLFYAVFEEKRIDVKADYE